MDISESVFQRAMVTAGNAFGAKFARDVGAVPVGRNWRANAELVQQLAAVSAHWHARLKRSGADEATIKRFIKGATKAALKRIGDTHRGRIKDGFS